MQAPRVLPQLVLAASQIAYNFLARLVHMKSRNPVWDVVQPPLRQQLAFFEVRKGQLVCVAVTPTANCVQAPIQPMTLSAHATDLLRFVRHAAPAVVFPCSRLPAAAVGVWPARHLHPHHHSCAARGPHGSIHRAQPEALMPASSDRPATLRCLGAQPGADAASRRQDETPAHVCANTRLFVQGRLQPAANGVRGVSNQSNTGAIWQNTRSYHQGGKENIWGACSEAGTLRAAQKPEQDRPTPATFLGSTQQRVLLQPSTI